MKHLPGFCPAVYPWALHASRRTASSRTSADRSAGTLGAHSARSFARDVPAPSGAPADLLASTRSVDCTKQTRRAPAPHEHGAFSGVLTRPEDAGALRSVVQPL